MSDTEALGIVRVDDLPGQQSELHPKPDWAMSGQVLHRHGGTIVNG